MKSSLGISNFLYAGQEATVRTGHGTTEIEENNRMEKTRDLFKKIRDTKGTFHAKMGSIKDRKWYGPNRSRRY